MPAVVNALDRLEAIRRASRERTRRWHEQRTAAGRCHRCPRFTEDAAWLCRRCRLHLSEIRRMKKSACLMVRNEGFAPSECSLK